MTRVSMVKSFGSSNAAGLSDLKSRLAGVDPSHIGPLQLQELFQKRLVGYAEVQLPKGTGVFPTYQLDRHVGVNDRYAPS